jgi:hypothetical protein
MKFKHNLEFETSDDINKSFEGGNKYLSNLITDIAIKNIKTKTKTIPVVQILAKEDELIYDVVIDREDLMVTLEENLKIMEGYEDYERCIKLKNALEYLKSK